MRGQKEPFGLKLKGNIHKEAVKSRKTAQFLRILSGFKKKVIGKEAL